MPRTPRAPSRATSSPAPPATRQPLQSVSIALDVLDTLAREPELSLSELARRIGVAKSTAHRTCSVLAERGLVARTSAGGYRLGLRFVEYGHLAAERTAVRDRACPCSWSCATRSAKPCRSGCRRARMSCTSSVSKDSRRSATRRTHGARPIHRSSAGKVLAAYIPEMLEARLAAGLTPSTGYTIVVPEVLVAELARIRERGWARSVDETELGLSSLAVPVRSAPDGPVVAAISMVGPTTRVIGDHEEHHVTVLRAGARKLTDAIGKGEYALRRRQRA